LAAKRTYEYSHARSVEVEWICKTLPDRASCIPLFQPARRLGAIALFPIRPGPKAEAAEKPYRTKQGGN
jgi:hypothetical protein